jgi:hypothetical protein
MRAAALAAAVICWGATVRAATTGEGGDGDFVPAATRPLVLLVQGDAVVSGTPARPGDAPEGASLRLRRARVGEDFMLGRRFRLRAVLEAQQADALGAHFEPLDGGRLAGPVRAVDSFASWTPSLAIHVDAGVLRVPFSLTRQVGDADLRLPERPAFARALTPDFRAGAGVSGDVGALAYAAAVMSASRFLDGDLFERGVLVAARLVAEPIGPVGMIPWRRSLDDPWTDWFRFRHAVSFLYGTLAEPRTLGAGMDLTAQWRRLVATAEYLLVHAPSGDRQGAALEPGVTLGARRLDIVARGAWERAGGVNGWGAGAAVTAYARDARARLQIGFERQAGAAPLVAASYALARLTFTID